MVKLDVIFPPAADDRDLHSFPTRRSSDLKALAEGKATTACAACHGAGLKGLGPVPALAGRSPSIMVRQMYDMKQGSRKGSRSEEHTSELQSQFHLVCRLLLEKKNNRIPLD